MAKDHIELLSAEEVDEAVDVVARFLLHCYGAETANLRANIEDDLSVTDVITRQIIDRVQYLTQDPGEDAYRGACNLLERALTW